VNDGHREIRELYRHLRIIKPTFDLSLANCAGRGDDMYVNVNGAGHIRQIKTAKEVCANCPVMAECFDWAADNNERHGVWGGVNFANIDERRAARSRRRRKK